MFDNAKLTNTVAGMNNSVTLRLGGEEPLVIVAAVAFINDTRVIRLNNAKIFISAAPGDDMGLVPFRQLHRHAERDQPEFTSLHLNLLRAPQIDPVRLSANISKPVYLVREIFDSYRLGIFHLILRQHSV